MPKPKPFRIRRGGLALVVGLLALLLTGCWDQRPVNSRDIVTTIGVDPGPSPGEYRWSFVFPNPTAAPIGVGGTGTGPEVFTTTVLGRTLASALVAAQRANTRELFTGHIRMLALSTKLSPSAWYHIIDAINRMGSVVETLWLVGVQNGQAVASYVPPSEQLPEVGTYQALACGCLPVNWGKRLWQTWVETETAGTSPTVPFVDIRGTTFHFDRIAVLSPQAVTVWSKAASEGWSYLDNRTVRASVTVSTPHGEVWGVQGVSGSAHVSFQNRADGVSARVVVREAGFLSDAPRHTVLSPAMEWHIEEAVSRHILHRCLIALSEARRTKTDPFGWHRDYRWEPVSLGHQRWENGWTHWHVHLTVVFDVKGEGLMR